ncbi:MAG: hypothetical protein C0501_26070 [Isosphaera sp.]|nr:hypothetical protein [Isosphaera sp.]
MAGVIDLQGVHKPAGPDYDSLRSYLSQLIGEPFLFARVGYGDELTLHLGTPRDARNPKLRNRVRGSYLLAVRGSAWQLKSGVAPVIVEAGVIDPLHLSQLYRPISTEELERTPFIQPGARVLAAEPFVARPTGGYGLLVAFSDGSAVLINPTPLEHPADEPGAPEKVPHISDWELLTPHARYLWVGPGSAWGYEPSRQAEPPVPTNPPKPSPPAAKKRPRKGGPSSG